MDRKDRVTQFAVLGLGRFGHSIVETLAEYNVHILAVDKDPNCLHNVTDYVTHAVQADVSDEEALLNMGIGNFDVVILTIGNDLEAVVLAIITAKEQGVKTVVAKAYGARQKKILESAGADIVIMPEVEMGSKVARRLVRPNVLDSLEWSGKFRIVEMHPPTEWCGKTVGNLNLHKKHGVVILAAVRGDETIFPIFAETSLLPDDILILMTKSGYDEYIDSLM